MGFITHRRYRGFNKLKIEGSDIIKNLPDKKCTLLFQIIKPILCGCSSYASCI